MTGVVVQVRLGSTRLPGKALLPLGDASVCDMVLRRLALVTADVLVLATDEASSASLGPVAARNGFELVVGPAEDVLARYCIALRRFGIDLLVRATGDNPLVSFELASLLLNGDEWEALAVTGGRVGRRADYSAHLGMPVGMGVELVRAEALYRAEAEATGDHDREHVCPYLYSHPELFSISRSDAPPEYQMPGARVTVDTQADYGSVADIYRSLYRGDPIASLDVIKLLRSREEQC